MTYIFTGVLDDAFDLEVVKTVAVVTQFVVNVRFCEIVVAFFVSL